VNILSHADEGALGSAVKNLQDVAGGLKTTADHVQETVQDGASAVAQQASEAWESVGQGVQAVAAVTQVAAPVWEGTSQVVADAVSRVESSAAAGSREAWADLKGLIRRYPVSALLVGFGVAFLLASATRRD
jgi:hypothetical protein